MARISYAQTNFTAGEISPRLTGRTDIDRYGNAVSLMQNAYPVIHGGAKSRAGTRYLQAAKNASKKARLVPFVYSRDDAYMLEFGDLYVRVFKAGGTYLGVEIATSYTEAMLADLDYVQGADTMFLAHPSVPIQRLRRLSDTVWDLSAAPFTVTPFDEQGHTPAATVTLSAATVGTGRTATASTAVFYPTDVGRAFLSGMGIAVVTGYTSTTVVTVTITVAFASTSLASGSWSLDTSPRAFLKPSAKDPVGSSITLLASGGRTGDVSLSAKSGAITINATSGAPFAAGDVGKTFFADSGTATITGFTNPAQISATTTADFAATTYATGSYGITENTFRAEDVGSFIRINGGMVKITGWNTTTAYATVITALTSTVVSPPLAWTLESSVWNAANGYPRTVTLHEQRLVAGGSPKYPQTFWGSRIGEYLDFTKGTNDDDSYSFTLANDEVNPISYLTSLRNLVVHTYGGEFSVQGGVEKPVTPTNVRIRSESSHGSRGVRPVTIGKESVFVQRAGRKVRALSYSFQFDGYAAPDLTVLAEHITDGGITSMAFQQEPDLILWAVRADGTMISCTLDREQQVTGWARHYTDGAFEWIATIPNGDREEAWALVRRTINGAVVRYVELLDEVFKPLLPGTVDPLAYPPVTAAKVYGYTVDCGASFDSATGLTSVSVPHLAGKTVAILTDGAVQPSQVVPVGGTITLPRSANRVLVGLPFLPKITLLTPEGGNATGTAQGNSMRTSELTLRFLETLGATVVDGEGNETEVPFTRFGPDILDQPPEAKTTQVRIEMLGWERGRSVVSVVQKQPLPMHLLSAVRKFQVND